MKFREILILLAIGAFVISCNLNAPDDEFEGTDPDTAIFRNVSSSHLPAGLSEATQKAKAADLDGDGDFDLALAVPFSSNKILINNGSGRFTDETSSRLSSQNAETRDLAAADFDSDGDLDLLFVGNQAQANQLFINNGNGSFSDLSNRISVSGNFTSVSAGDVNDTGTTDIVIGNIGQNAILINSGNAFFTNETTDRFPQQPDDTRDIELADITDDNLPDIIIGNENGTRILINSGTGFFEDQTENRILSTIETKGIQDIELADADGDHDLDIYFGNSALETGSNPPDQLLINDGQGFFSDQTADLLPADSTNTFDAEFADLDGDGDFDLIVGNYNGGLRVLINDGNGSFSDETTDWVPENFLPNVIDLEIADFNNDGWLDLYIAVRDDNDQLLLQR